MGERRGIYRVLVKKPEGKRPLGKPRSKWEEDISSGSETWGYGVNRAGSEYGHVVGPCDYGNEPWGSTQCEEFLDWLKTG